MQRAKGNKPFPEHKGRLATSSAGATITSIATAEAHQVAVARALEVIDYQVLRGLLADNATDYESTSKASRLFFATMQNKLYRHITGMTAQQIIQSRQITMWKGREAGMALPSAAERKVAKNYLSRQELRKLDRLVGRLCLRAEDIAEDGFRLSLSQWEELAERELRMDFRPSLAA